MSAAGNNRMISADVASESVARASNMISEGARMIRHACGRDARSVVRRLSLEAARRGEEARHSALLEAAEAISRLFDLEGSEEEPDTGGDVT
jgi:hypothetical protein